MAVYVVRTWHNSDEQDVSGTAAEYEVAVGEDDAGGAVDATTAQLRLLEAIAINLASLAESTDRLVAESRAANRARYGV